jgi:high-affinity Fe2+/Pb2+ permease
MPALATRERESAGVSAHAAPRDFLLTSYAVRLFWIAAVAYVIIIVVVAAVVIAATVVVVVVVIATADTAIVIGGGHIVVALGVCIVEVVVAEARARADDFWDHTLAGNVLHFTVWPCHL